MPRWWRRLALAAVAALAGLHATRNALLQRAGNASVAPSTPAPPSVGAALPSPRAEHGHVRQQDAVLAGPVQWQELAKSTQQTFLMGGSAELVEYFISHDAFEAKQTTPAPCTVPVCERVLIA